MDFNLISVTNNTMGSHPLKLIFACCKETVSGRLVELIPPKKE
jgi:hypothetical protein